MGTISEQDLKNTSDSRSNVSTVMEKLDDFQRVSPNDDASDVLTRMIKNNQDKVLVFEDEKVIGIVALSDLQKVIKDH